MPDNTMNTKRKDVLARIESFEKAITKAREFLETGKHAHWSGFRPLFVHKLKDGKELPPHKDWIKNVFLPNSEKALRRAEKTLERLESGLTMRSSEHAPLVADLGVV
jgi:hypothetical protein